MKLNYNIGLFAIGLMVLSSCSSTKYVPDGEYLLRKTRVDFKSSEPRLSKSPHLSGNDFVTLQRQTPNSRLFWVFPLRLNMYNSVDTEKNTWWTRTMQKYGQPPVIFDSIFAIQTVQQMRQHLVNKGHFNSNVHFETTVLRDKKRSVVYFINTGQEHRYRNVTLDVKNENLIDEFENWHANTLIKSGDPYDVEILEAERLRVERKLRNRGYYFFNRDHIDFLINDTLGNYLMDVEMVVSLPENSVHSEQFRYADVFVFPDEPPTQTAQKFDTTKFYFPRSQTDTTLLNYYFIHTKPLQIRPNIVASKLFIQPDDLYSLNSINQTYENLLDLRMYRAANILVQPLPVDSNNPEHLLNATIEMRQLPTWTMEANLDLSTTSGLQGISTNAAILNRNLFGGAEIFRLQLRGLFEMQYPLNKTRRETTTGSELINNFDIRVNASIEFPRFLTPFDLGQTNQLRPRTMMTIGYSYQDRPALYNRNMVNAALAYLWRKSHISHVLSPLDLSLVNISLQERFRQMIESSQNNTRLKNQYGNHFIFAARYGFSYSGQKDRSSSFNMFRFSIESCGNSLYLLSNSLGAPKINNEYYQFFNLRYAQYIRIDADARRYWYLNNSRFFVTRLMGGSGFSYGNFDVLPFEKGFFAGGTNNIRAWPLNYLGPGSYNLPPDKSNIERVGDIVLVGNLEYRFPLAGAFKGALFVDAGNIWVRERGDSILFPNGNFSWKNVPNDLAVGGGFGLRWDLNFVVVRLDAAVPLRDPAKPNREKWVISKMQRRDFVLNFGIGYPF